MEHVIVERTFPTPQSVEDIRALKERLASCMDQNRIRYIQGYLSLDQTRMICIYEAPDAEAVRRYSLQAALPFDRIWTASPVV